MSVWLPPAFARLPEDQHETCERGDCVEQRHRATYQVETANTQTGEVRRIHLCTKAAATLAWKRQVAFPPGPSRSVAQRKAASHVD